MDVHHPSDSGCVVSLSFTACSGHHISLRLLSLHLCNEYLSLPKKKKNCTGCCAGEHLGLSRHLSRLFATAGLSWWLSRDVVESQLLGRGVRRGNSTQNHALSGCARLIRLVSRCLLSATTRDAFAASQGPIWRCDAAEDGV